MNRTALNTTYPIGSVVMYEVLAGAAREGGRGTVIGYGEREYKRCLYIRREDGSTTLLHPNWVTHCGTVAQ